MRFDLSLRKSFRVCDCVRRMVGNIQIFHDMNIGFLHVITTTILIIHCSLIIKSAHSISFSEEHFSKFEKKINRHFTHTHKAYHIAKNEHTWNSQNRFVIYFDFWIITRFSRWNLIFEQQNEISYTDNGQSE